jgi:hypothetical protein
MSTASTPVALVDVLDRVLDRGTVIHGDLVLSIADIDLVRLSLSVLLASIRAEQVEREPQ